MYNGEIEEQKAVEVLEEGCMHSVMLLPPFSILSLLFPSSPRPQHRNMSFPSCLQSLGHRQSRVIEVLEEK